MSEIKAFLEIKGAEIAGYAVREGQPRPCSLHGEIGSEGTLRKPIRITCESTQDRETRFDSLTIDLEGQFTAEGGGSGFTGETTFRSSDRRTGKATWSRLSEASPDTQHFRRFR